MAQFYTHDFLGLKETCTGLQSLTKIKTKVLSSSVQDLFDATKSRLKLSVYSDLTVLLLLLF